MMSKSVFSNKLLLALLVFTLTTLGLAVDAQAQSNNQESKRRINKSEVKDQKSCELYVNQRVNNVSRVQALVEKRVQKLGQKHDELEGKIAERKSEQLPAEDRQILIQSINDARDKTKELQQKANSAKEVDQATASLCKLYFKPSITFKLSKKIKYVIALNRINNVSARFIDVFNKIDFSKYGDRYKNINIPLAERVELARERIKKANDEGNALKNQLLTTDDTSGANKESVQAILDTVKSSVYPVIEIFPIVKVGEKYTPKTDIKINQVTLTQNGNKLPESSSGMRATEARVDYTIVKGVRSNNPFGAIITDKDITDRFERKDRKDDWKEVKNKPSNN